MARLNLTLDAATETRLESTAKRAGKPRATMAREIIREALDRRERLDTMRRLARDYAAGREDARALLEELEGAQLGLLGDEED